MNIPAFWVERRRFPGAVAWDKVAGMTVDPITPDHPAFAELIAVYEDAFFVGERLPHDRLVELLRAGRMEAFALRDAGAVAGMALVARFPAFAHLDYLAVRRADRGRGVGSRVLAGVVAHLGAHAPDLALLSLEVGDDAPVPGEIGADRLRRIRFYRARGAVLLANVDYLFPAYGRDPIPMNLMAFPLRDDPITTERVGEVIHDLYVGLHGRDPTDPTLQDLLRKLPPRIEIQ